MRVRRAVGVVAVALLAVAGLAGPVGAQPATADVSVIKVDSPDPVAAGANLTYTIIIVNEGPSAAQGVTLLDTVPAGTTFVSVSQTMGPAFSCTTPAVGGTGQVTCQIATLANAAVVMFTVVVHVDPTAAVGSSIGNLAQVFAGNDTDQGNNTALALTAVAEAQADVAVTKSDAPDPVVAGADLTYTINVTNIGPSDAQTVGFSDTVPTDTTFVSLSQTGPAFTCTTPPVGGTGAITCTIATLALGASASFTVVVRVDPTAAVGSVITNTATVTTTTTDPNADNNTATATTTVTNPPRDDDDERGDEHVTPTTTIPTVSAPVAVEVAPGFTG
jgi:uncharacterized repeat protein (TIGR01451 family)